MGIQTIIHGYVELLESDYEPFINSITDNKSSSDFRRIDFSGSNCGYRSCVVSFAKSVKSDCQEWPEILKLFENILKVNKGISARITFEEEGSGKDETYLYLNIGDSRQKTDKKWMRWKRKLDKNVDEVVL